MGQLETKERSLYAQMLKNMLRARGARVTTSQLERFLNFVQEVCPWFPEEGTVNLETWQKIGKQMHNHYKPFGPSKTPGDAFSLWNLIRDCLDPRHDHNQPSLKPEKKKRNIKNCIREEAPALNNLRNTSCKGLMFLRIRNYKKKRNIKRKLIK